MTDLTPEQADLGDQLLELVRNSRYHFIYIESPGAVYGTPWDVSDDDWEEIEGFDLHSEENVRAIVEKVLMPLATSEAPIYFGSKPPSIEQGPQVWIDVPCENSEPINAELQVFWQRGSGGYYPSDTHMHITKRNRDWVRPSST